MDILPFETVYEKIKDIRAGCHKSELEHLYTLASQAPEDALIVEVGSYLGSSAVTMAHTGRRIICIDCFKAYFDGFGQDQVVMHEEFRKNTRDYENIKLYRMESYKAEKYIKEPIDLLFIDGDHEYEGVKLDCNLYLPKVRPGGLAAFHDYQNTACPGVKQAVDEATGDWETVSNLWSIITKRKPM